MQIYVFDNVNMTAKLYGYDEVGETTVRSAKNQTVNIKNSKFTIPKSICHTFLSTPFCVQRHVVILRNRQVVRLPTFVFFNHPIDWKHYFTLEILLYRKSGVTDDAPLPPSSPIARHMPSFFYRASGSVLTSLDEFHRILVTHAERFRRRRYSSTFCCC